MKKLLGIVVLGLLFCNTAQALPECEGDDYKKWYNCFGSYAWEKSNLKYEGEWDKGVMHGKGTYSLISFEPKLVMTISGGYIETVVPMTKSGGVIYIGEFHYGKANGQGTWIYCAYSKPNRCHSKLNEQGIWIYKDGGKYVGQIKNGLEHGEGTKTYASGNIVEGIWKKGKLVKIK